MSLLCLLALLDVFFLSVFDFFPYSLTRRYVGVGVCDMGKGLIGNCPFLALSSGPFSMFPYWTLICTPRFIPFLHSLDPKIAPALQHQAEELKRAQLETALAHKIERRPPVSELIDHNILRGELLSFSPIPSQSLREFFFLLVTPPNPAISHPWRHVLDSHVAPALQRQEAELKRSQLEDMLNTKIHDRPKPDELVEKHILGNAQRSKHKGIFIIHSGLTCCHLLSSFLVHCRRSSRLSRVSNLWKRQGFHICCCCFGRLSFPFCHQRYRTMFHPLEEVPHE